jgi:hypothetical protein
MSYFFAYLILYVAYSMSLEGLAFWWDIAGSRSFCTSYMFYLISSHLFIEVSGLSKEVDNVFGCHSRV